MATTATRDITAVVFVAASYGGSGSRLRKERKTSVWPQLLVRANLLR